MTTYELRRATLGDIRHVCSHATNECMVANETFLGCSPSSAAARLVPASREPASWLVDGEPACVFGISSYAALSTTGYPWIFYTPLVHHHRTHFIRRCREWMKVSMEEWRRLEAFVDPSDPSAVRWMQFMGFMLDEPEPMGPWGAVFHRAHAERSD